MVNVECCTCEEELISSFFEMALLYIFAKLRKKTTIIQFMVIIVI